MAESAEFRWGDVTECCSCGSADIERQTAEEGRPFSCNNCGLEFFKDTGSHVMVSDGRRLIGRDDVLRPF